MRVGELLVSLGIVTAKDVAAALEQQKKCGRMLGEILISKGLLTKQQLNAVLKLQREVGDALPACERALAKFEAGFGPAHPHTSRARINLARLLVLAGRPGEALPHGHAALAHYRQAFGTKHAWTAEAAKVIADAETALRRSGSN